VETVAQGARTANKLLLAVWVLRLRHTAKAHRAIDHHLVGLLSQLLRKTAQISTRGAKRFSTDQVFVDLRYVQLRRVRVQETAPWALHEASPESRMRENPHVRFDERGRETGPERLLRALPRLYLWSSVKNDAPRPGHEYPALDPPVVRLRCRLTGLLGRSIARGAARLSLRPLGSRLEFAQNCRSEAPSEPI